MPYHHHFSTFLSKSSWKWLSNRGCSSMVPSVTGSSILRSPSHSRCSPFSTTTTSTSTTTTSPPFPTYRAHELNEKLLMNHDLHLGHEWTRTSSKAALSYVLGTRQGLCILDLHQTLQRLRHVMYFLMLLSQRNGSVLFVGGTHSSTTSSSSSSSSSSVHDLQEQWQAIDLALYCQQYYVTEWRPGTFTNLHTMIKEKRTPSWSSPPSLQWTQRKKNPKKSLPSFLQNTLERKEKELHPDSSPGTPPTSPPPPFPLSSGGTTTSSTSTGLHRSYPYPSYHPHPHHHAWVLPDCIICINDSIHCQRALREAQLMKIPSIALVDSDMDPTSVTYPIPGNNDSVRGNQLVFGCLAQALVDGKALMSARHHTHTQTHPQTSPPPS
ncbi:hypothetical protein HMI54_000474 [Coelomomyces lativittatus]|nr:hypothetical protein HMI56_000373 [Coelomomyces lativittatus]KAJ1511825.1 hypothetical protein HMI54_000474 [Coelomomyces lativittatus]KAJ1515725.1 hypothetical protein HMI55_003394 [Coelomomyces lativittatus]